MGNKSGAAITGWIAPSSNRGLFASQNYLKDAGDLSIYRPRMTSRSTTASAPDPGS